MKKKFLSLMMAAAVVATTSVSAFASQLPGAADTSATTTTENNINSLESVTMPTESNINSLDSDEATQNVIITGKVQDNNGKMPTANFKVTVPTAASFTVNKDGNLIGPILKVKNEGAQAIKVLAQDFQNVGSGEIKVIDSQSIADDTANQDEGQRRYDRKTISLKLEGDNNKVAYLSSADGKNGVSDQKNLGELKTGGVELVTLQPGDKVATTKTITLKGTAGSKPIQSPVSNDFRLTLKIKKAN